MPEEHPETANVSLRLQEKRRWKLFSLLTVCKALSRGGEPFHQQTETHKH